MNLQRFGFQTRGFRFSIQLFSLRHILPFSVAVLFLLLTVHSSLLTVSAIAQEEEERTYSLNLVDEEMRTVLKLLANESGRNIIIPETITGKVTLTLDKVTLGDALDVILKAHGLGYVSEKGVIRIVRLSEVEIAGEELVTEVVVVNYARAADLVNQVKGVLSPKGTVSADSRTNSFIIKDVKKGIEDARALIGRLDPMTPQVLIEARIIEASNNFSRSLGIQWGAAYTASPAFGNPLGYNFPNTVSVGGGVGASPGGTSYMVNLPASNPAGGIGITMGSINNNLTLDVQLTAGERTGDVRIVSSPKVTTVNNKPATVSSGIEYSVKSTSATGGAQSTTVSAKTSITVTPQVSGDGHIMLLIDASRDEPDFTRLVDGVPGILRKNANTTVLVKDGETTVIGGLYRNSKGAIEISVPFFSKIPVIGWLFKSKNRTEENEELLIFITPRIIRNQG